MAITRDGKSILSPPQASNHHSSQDSNKRGTIYIRRLDKANPMWGGAFHLRQKALFNKRPKD